MNYNTKMLLLINQQKIYSLIRLIQNLNFQEQLMFCSSLIGLSPALCSADLPMAPVQ